MTIHELIRQAARIVETIAGWVDRSTENRIIGSLTSNYNDTFGLKGLTL